MARYQGLRPSLMDFGDALARLTMPVLLVVGDEDEPCLDINLFLKRTIPTAGLWFFPNTGHAVNLEEPAAFNAVVQDFLGAVEGGRWRRGVP
jgi:pimeloyl-ACP methyl ester carboxylesterase